MSWSVDLRERVVFYIEGGGKKSKASELFKISRPTIDSWLLRKKEKGNLNPNDYIRESKIDNEKLISFVEKNSNQYMGGKNIVSITITWANCYYR